MRFSFVEKHSTVAHIDISHKSKVRKHYKQNKTKARGLRARQRPGDPTLLPGSYDLNRTYVRYSDDKPRVTHPNPLNVSVTYGMVWLDIEVF